MTNKRILLLTACCIALLTFSCTADDCQDCRIVVRNLDGSIYSAETSAEYCAEELDEIEAESPTTVGGRTSSWECD